MNVAIVIPARYRSSRFPGKPLADIVGKPMIQHVYERSIQAKHASEVIVATDDLRIFKAVRKFGGNVVMTSPEHETGTDRVIEVSKRITADIIINVQGDEPLINPQDIDLLIENMLQSTCKVATLCHSVKEEEALSPNVVKVIRSADGRALYFSRRLIPYTREKQQQVNYLKHVGIYGYTADLLEIYNELPFSQLEDMEKLEQLRLIEAGISINLIEVDSIQQGVDTPADLEVVRRYLSSSSDEKHMPQQAISL